MKVCTRRQWGSAILCIAALGFLGTEANAGSVQQLNLVDMTQRASKIFRGRVLTASAGTVVVGGVTLPTVTYRFEVEDALRGNFYTSKGATYADVTTIGKVTKKQAGRYESVTVVPQMPKLTAGRSYFLFVTEPSAAGLSTTVGLGQGSFALTQAGGTLFAENELKNRGLFRGMQNPGPASGPIPYDELASRVRTFVRKP